MEEPEKTDLDKQTDKLENIEVLLSEISRLEDEVMALKKELLNETIESEKEKEECTPIWLIDTLIIASIIMFFVSITLLYLYG